ncbi:cell division protein FtsX [Flaviaesturariibacter amylovorans]|uniref:Cell division protein FtsX n=1 Tax=Flaviaesturariibacter amylovorans TaxID=1084520 RepID=A0ABP8G5Q0_9BACT
MAQFGKASSKRGKPSYFMSVLGVTIVLFLLGLLGWLGINSKKLMQHFKESLQVQVYLKPNVNERDRTALQDSLERLPMVKSVEYIDKDAAKREWLKAGNEDFTGFLEENLLPTSINFNLKEQFVDSANVAAVQSGLSRLPIVDEVVYSKGVVGAMQRNFQVVTLVLLVIVIIVAILVIILIDNTIRLAMFSNRFLIKTMQMVGATRGFIARPLNIRAVLNGALAAVIATAVLYGAILLLESFAPGISALFDRELFFLLFLGLLAIGISITFISTYRSVRKYLKMKLDELY